MKHFGIITIILVIFMFSSVFASEVNTLAAAKPRAEEGRVILPLELKNIQAMAALDLPLKYSEGVTLEEVSFEGTRSADFDFKWANIDNTEHIVILGLIPMVFGNKSDLEPGEGVVANMIFRVDDPNIKSIELTPITVTNPDHSPMFIYTDANKEVQSLTPELVGFSMPLSAPPEVSENPVLPKEFALKQNAPNPFNPTTYISFDLPKACDVQVEIYNVLGQSVRTLVNGYQEAGSQSVMWDGSDNSGNSVASGVYFYRINAGDYSATKKMMMLK
jgi:hypothetical protein